ncbi:hypothetical protein K523DRAFT_323801 [Schizophyllum commune Tattone D]|nr:hypothetical protein K523DRAFT_323801 [Schizophyllum commune Tattone D]
MTEAAQRGVLMDFRGLSTNDNHAAWTESTWKSSVARGREVAQSASATVLREFDSSLPACIAHSIQSFVLTVPVLAALFGSSLDAEITGNYPPSVVTGGVIERSKALALLAYIGSVYHQDRARAEEVAKCMFRPIVMQAKNTYIQLSYDAPAAQDRALDVARSLFEAAMNAPQPFRVVDTSEDRYHVRAPADPASLKPGSPSPEYADLPLDAADLASGLSPVADLEHIADPDLAADSVRTALAPEAPTAGEPSTLVATTRSPSPAVLPSTSFLAEHPQFVRPESSRVASKRKPDDDGTSDDAGKTGEARTRQKRARG